MKKYLKSLLVLTLVVSCFALVTACAATKMPNGTYTLETISMKEGGVTVTVDVADLQDFLAGLIDSMDPTCGLCEGTALTGCLDCGGSGHCSNCGGSGEYDSDICPTCNGDTYCNNCGGTGKEECWACDGTGEIEIDEDSFSFLTDMTFIVDGKKITMMDETIDYKLDSKGNIKFYIDGEQIDMNEGAEGGMSMSFKYKSKKIILSVTMVQEGVTVMDLSMTFKKTA